MSPTSSPTEQQPEAAHALACMEVWGGNQAIENAVSVPGMDVWVYSHPYHGGAEPAGDSDQGGDIYYISTCGAGRLSRFVLADVTGHGPAVGQLAGSLRNLMRKYSNTLDQTRFAKSINKDFSSSVSMGRFATAILSSYYAPDQQFIVCNAGHPPPLWYNARSGAWQFLKYDHPACSKEAMNLPLGIIEPTDYHQFAVGLEKGDLVLIYTDSLIEAKAAVPRRGQPDPGSSWTSMDAVGGGARSGGGHHSSEGGMLGMEGLLGLARHIDTSRPDRVGPLLLKAVAGFRGNDPPDDDETLIVLHHNAAGPRQLSLGDRVRVMGKMLGLIR